MSTDNRTNALKEQFPWFFGTARSCDFEYRRGDRCGGTVSQHNLRPAHMPQNQPVEPTIFDHAFTDADARAQEATR